MKLLREFLRIARFAILKRVFPGLERTPRLYLREALPLPSCDRPANSLQHGEVGSGYVGKNRGLPIMSDAAVAAGANKSVGSMRGNLKV